MKKCFILLIIFLFIINNIAFAALNSYPVNSTPATEDRMLGIDDPTGTWSTKLYSLSSVFNLFQSQNYNFTGAVDFSNATSISSGPLIFTSSGTLPEAVDGRLFYYSGLGYNAFGFYSITTPRYILDYGSPPADGQVLVYRSGTGFTWETKTSLPNGTSTNDILSWDGDSWEPIALSDHPAFAELLTAFNNAGLNSFVFTPNTSFPLWAGASPVSVSLDVTDTSSAYAIDTVNFQYDGTGGFINALTNTTGDTYTGSVTIAADGAHTIQLEASDDKSTPNTGRSATYTINFDGTLPVVNAGSDQTHDGTGQQITVSGITITEANETARERQIYNTTDAAVESTWAAFTGTSFAYTLPANTDSYRFDVRVTDPIRSVTDSVNVNYAGGGSGSLEVYIAGSENNGATLSTGSGTLTVSGMTYAVDHNSVTDGAFLNSTGYAEIQTSGNIDYAVGKISFWVYPTATQTAQQYRYLFSDASDYHVFCLVHEADNRLRFRTTSGSAYFAAATSTAALTQNVWHFVELTWSDVTDLVTLRIDGGTIDSQALSFTGATESATFRLFNGSGGGSAGYQGRFDTISIFSTTTEE